MSAKMVLSCCGCDARTEVFLRRHRQVVGSLRVAGELIDKQLVRADTIEDATPDGWVVWDPWTDLTYCPRCWGEIQG